MDTAIITGAASGVGLSIAKKLVENGFRVYGLGGNYADCPYQNKDFIPLPCDLGDPLQVDRRLENILEKEGGVLVVVNNAKRYLTKPLEESTTAELQSALQVNLLCPLQILRSCLPHLRHLQGYVINITVNTWEFARGGPVGAASSGGLRWLSDVLFEENRDFGVKVTTLFPQSNRRRPDGAPPPPADHPSSAIDPEVVAEAVFDIIFNKSGNTFTELVLRPQRFIEKPAPAPWQIPFATPSSELLTTPYTPQAAPALRTLSANMEAEATALYGPPLVQEPETPKRRPSRSTAASLVENLEDQSAADDDADDDDRFPTSQEDSEDLIEPEEPDDPDAGEEPADEVKKPPAAKAKPVPKTRPAAPGKKAPLPPRKDPPVSKTPPPSSVPISKASDYVSREELDEMGPISFKPARKTPAVRRGSRHRKNTAAEIQIAAIVPPAPEPASEPPTAIAAVTGPPTIVPDEAISPPLANDSTAPAPAPAPAEPITAIEPAVQPPAEPTANVPTAEPVETPLAVAEAPAPEEIPPPAPIVIEEVPAPVTPPSLVEPSPPAAPGEKSPPTGPEKSPSRKIRRNR